MKKKERTLNWRRIVPVREKSFSECNENDFDRVAFLEICYDYLVRRIFSTSKIFLSLIVVYPKILGMFLSVKHLIRFLNLVVLITSE